MTNGLVLQKNPVLPTAQDYYQLRQQGLDFIELLGSARWTDYNSHDPGITTLEAFCYALGELGYRVGFDIADILTEANGFIGFKQALFTARRILTNYPWTVTDFRKILVDLPGVRNGWLLCKDCACETLLYAECKESTLSFAPLWRLKPPFLGQEFRAHEHPVTVRGLYDVLLELDEDSELGDLNDRKILHNLNFPLPEAGQFAPLTIEVRFPDWEADRPDDYTLFSGADAFITDVVVDRFSRDRVLVEPVTNDSFVAGWRNLFFADFTIKFKADLLAPETTLTLVAATIRFFSSQESVKRKVDVANLENNVLPDHLPGSIADKYRRKLQKVAEATAAAGFALHQYRNLCEDFCRIECVRVEDVAVCADIEVAADADIEWVLANVYNQIELYFNPPVRFYTLRELEAEGLAADEIFEGPALENGFIKTEEMEAAQLRSVIHVSDLYNLLMDIPGIIAVKDLMLTRYDREGNPILPAQRWTVTISPRSIPRLYVEASRMLFYKNGLPFLPRMEEARAILVQLRGERERPKIPSAENDYPVPAGTWHDWADYHPVQHTFPRTYGIGPPGLPPTATALRQAQALQFKGYLMIYEQLIANMLEQLAHTFELFSTDENLQRTYFAHYFDPLLAPPQIARLPELLTAQATQTNLEALIEPQEVFYDRRNRFLDHVLARFGEQFRDYALMLYSNADRIAFAPEKLILDKARFLRDYPAISAQRGKAFNYKDQDRLCDPRNRAGLSARISRLLGMEMLRSYFTVTVLAGQNTFTATFVLTHRDTGVILLRQAAPIPAESGEAAEDAAWTIIGDVIANSPNPLRYVNVSGDDLLRDETGVDIALVEPGVAPGDVQDFAAEILEKERLYIVEHLLLRPKFPGDALLPVCLDDACSMCGEEDPYSFQLTFVAQGDLEPFSLDIDLRRFADNTIRKETPSHLLPKICWVANLGVEPDPCAAVFGRVAAILQKYDAALTSDAACACAQAVYDAHDDLFQAWFAGKELAFHSEAAWQTLLQTLFAPVAKGDFPCTAGIPDAAWQEVQAALLAHFTYIAAHGFQFDRLEKAWCAWLEVNAPFEWQKENELLHKQVEALLLKYFPKTPEATGQACACSDLLLGYFGNRFREWMEARIDALAEDDVLLLLDDPAALGAALESDVWDPFWEDLERMVQYQAAPCLPPGLPPATSAFWAELKARLLTTYTDNTTPPYISWALVSYRLHVLLRVFTRLSSIYPSATLHDCDDGSDDNPVRLNNTILGTM